MNYPLKVLFPVRERREEEMIKELQQARHAYEEALEHWRLKQEELNLYRQQKPGLRDQAYGRVIGSDCSQQKIDELHQELKEIEEWELRLVEEITAAEQERDKRKDVVVVCEGNLKQAQISLEKLKTHREIWGTEQKALREKREEKELEDHIDSRHQKQKTPASESKHFSIF